MSEDRRQKTEDRRQEPSPPTPLPQSGRGEDAGGRGQISIGGVTAARVAGLRRLAAAAAGLHPEDAAAMRQAAFERIGRLICQ